MWKYDIRVYIWIQTRLIWFRAGGGYFRLYHGRVASVIRVNWAYSGQRASNSKTKDARNRIGWPRERPSSFRSPGEPPFITNPTGIYPQITLFPFRKLPGPKLQRHQSDQQIKIINNHQKNNQKHDFYHRLWKEED